MVVWDLKLQQQQQLQVRLSQLKVSNTLLTRELLSSMKRYIERSFLSQYLFCYFLLGRCPKKFHEKIVCLEWSNLPYKHDIFVTKKFRTLDPLPPTV